MSSKCMFAHEFVRKPQHEIESILTEKPEILVDKDENERFILHWAALAGHDKLCEYILTRHPEQRDAEDEMKATPLIMATLGGFLPTVTLLVRAGANINHRNGGGHSALQYACSKGKLDIVLYLLQMRADVNIVDELGDTPMHRATTKGYHAIVEVLGSYRANLNLANKQGNTPLHIACEDDERACAILLLKRGASRTALNADEKNPLDLASRPLLLLIANEFDGRQAG